MNKCKVEGCNNKHYGKGYCSKHYQQYKRCGHILNRTKFDSNEIVIYDDYAEIVLYDRDNMEIARALIDLEDVDKVKDYKWHLDSGGYIVNSKVGKLHRFLMNPKDNEIVDHINGNPLDNRKCNLRVCSQNQNMMNQQKRKNTSSKFKGCSWAKNKSKWCVHIQINKKIKHIGYYNSEEEGAISYDKAAIKYYGIYAKTNFPIENYYSYIIDLGLDLNDFNIDNNEQSEDDLNE